MTPAAATKNLSVGQRIVWARKRIGLSQEGLAASIGTSRRHMIRLEKDQHKPGRHFIERIAVATGQAEELFVADDDEEADSLYADLVQVMRRVARHEAEKIVGGARA